MKEKLSLAWQQMTIKRKIAAFTGVVFLMIFLSIVFEMWIVKVSFLDFNNILVDNEKCGELVSAVREESKAFELYIKNPDDDNEKRLADAMKRTQTAVYALPFVYGEIGELRYARTWTVRNSYEVYSEKRDALLDMSEDMPDYIGNLYEVYEMQGFLAGYAEALRDCTIEDGSRVYAQKAPKLVSVPVAIIILEIILLAGVLQTARIMYRTIIYPVLELGRVSKRIAENDFFAEDVQVENQDELGELVHAFNTMKYATGEYILALEEKRKALELLHEKEMAKLETEKRLESMKLELLKSQVNPHFLFNTLNVISGMASLEEAAITEKMTKALSALFRYNLKTPEEEVPLSRELKVVADYMYLQEMRFGSRISYRVICEVNEEKTFVPAFIFQPLVENAIIHGLSPKEEGGRIYVRIRKNCGMLSIVIADTGDGMTKEELGGLRARLAREEEGHVGIGLGNVYQRIISGYQGSRLRIRSRKSVGTVIRIMIPEQ